MKQLTFLLLSVLMLLAVTACCEKKTVPKTQPIENTQNSLTEETSDERTDGVEAALQQLDHFTDLIEQGEGEQAAQLLRDGIRRHKEKHGYL